MFFDHMFIALVAITTSLGVAQGLTAQPGITQNPENFSSILPINSIKPFGFPAYDSQENLNIVELSKRAQEPDTIVSIVYALVTKLKELGLEWLINEKLFFKIVKKGTDRELHFPIGVTHRVFETKHQKRFNLGYCAKQRTLDTPASRRNAGENFGGIEFADDGYSLVSLISGNSGSFPAGRDSTDLCEKMDNVVHEFFHRIENKLDFVPKTLVKFAWDVVRTPQAPPGCFSMLHAIISPKNQIRISNLGPSWAGLYRDGEVVKSTTKQVHEDGSGYQVCNNAAEYSPGPTDLVQVSENYVWQAQKNDIFVIVSEGVQEVLSASEIGNAFSLIKRLGPEANAFMNESDPDLYAMGVVKAARIASGDQPKADLLVEIVEIGASA